MEMNQRMQRRDVEPAPRSPAFIGNRPNTGLPPSGFNAQDQYVDVSDDGPNPWQAPLPGAKRGQCPGLNAAANHGFLNRNGISTITQGTFAYTLFPAFDTDNYLAIEVLAQHITWARTWLLFWPSLPLDLAVTH
jgi:hypothetical protein